MYGSQNTKKIGSALITPDSPLYGFKRAIENVYLNLPGNGSNSTEKNLIKSENRLPELKTSLKKGNISEAENLLAESEQYLSAAADTSLQKDSANVDLTSVKQINDLNYATLAEVAKDIPPDKKDQFVDLVYNFTKQNEKEVQPIVAKSVIANPLQQKPLIGTIKQIDHQNVIVQFDSGEQKTVEVGQFTPVRDFHSEQLDDKNQLNPGSKIAIIGQPAKNGVIVSQFVLKNIPSELPDRHEGTVIEIDPKDKILKIKEQNDIKTIEINDSTILKGSNTGVSLEGIKAGSQVTVFGEYQATQSGILNNAKGNSQSGNNQPTPKPSGTVGPASKINQSSIRDSKIKSDKESSGQIIKATTISVTGNSSGKQEISEPKTSDQPKPAEPPPAPKTK